MVTFSLSLFGYPLRSRCGDFNFGPDLFLWFTFKGRNLNHSRGCWELQELEHLLVSFDVFQSFALYIRKKRQKAVSDRVKRRNDTVTNSN